MEPITNFPTQNLNQNITPIIPQRNIFKILFFIFLGLFLIVASVLTTLLITKTKTPVSNQNILVPTTTPNTDPTADWKNYNNSKLGFSFKYPSDWTLNETGESIVFKNNSETFTIYFSEIGRGYEGITSFIKYDAIIKNNLIALSNKTEKTSKTLETVNGSIATKGYAITTTAGKYTFIMEGTNVSNLNNGISTFEQILKSFKFEDLANTTIKDWQTYNSTDLGLSFKYPLSWGEPKVTKEDFNGRTTDNALNGKSVSISFKDIVRVVGYSKNYSNYVSTHYVGDQTNLDGIEEFNKKSGEIYFTKKAVVANQKTLIKTLLEYLPEASGTLIKSETNLNGKTEYTGIQVLTYYPSLNKKINSYYNEIGENKELETETIKSLTELKEGMSTDKETLNTYNEYQLWLTTFKFN